LQENKVALTVFAINIFCVVGIFVCLKTEEYNMVRYLAVVIGFSAFVATFM